MCMYVLDVHVRLLKLFRKFSLKEGNKNMK